MTINGANTALSDHFSAIQREIFEFQTAIGDAFIHTSKLASLSGQLFNFRKNISEDNFPVAYPTPKQKLCIDEIIQIIRNFGAIAKSLSSQMWLSFVLDHNPGDLREFIQNRKSKIITNLQNFSYIDVSPLESSEMDTQNEFSDIEDIKNRLGEFMNEKRYKEMDKKIQKKVGKKYKEYTEYLQTIGTNEADTGGELSENDIKTRLKDNTNIAKFIIDKKTIKINKKEALNDPATVFIGTDTKTSKMLAVKIIQKKTMNQKEFDKLTRQISTLIELNNFASVKFFGICIDFPIYIITEFVPKGTLYQRLGKKPYLDGTKKTIIALGIAIAINELHSKNMLHRNLSAKNVFIDENDNPKLSGFSTACDSTNLQKVSGALEDPRWTAPELINGQEYSKMVDVYSFGIILWELETLQEPYKGMRPTEVMIHVTKNNNRLMIPDKCHPVMKRLITQCWNKDPNARPTIPNIVRMISEGKVMFSGTSMNQVRNYINNFDKDAIQNAKTEISFFDTNKPKEETVTKVIDTLQNAKIDHRGAFMFFDVISKDKRWKPFIDPLIKKIVSYLKTNISVQNAQIAVRAFSTLIGNNIDAKEFTDYGILGISLETFQRFGSTAMTEILEIIKYALDNKIEVALSQQLAHKLYTLLESSTLETRKNATDVFLEVVSQSSFTNAVDLIEFIPPALKNMETDVLMKNSLRLINQIVTKGNCINEFINAQGILKFFNFIVTDDDYGIKADDSVIIFSILLRAFKEPQKLDTLYFIVAKLSQSINLISSDDILNLTATTSFAFSCQTPHDIIKKYIDFITECLKSDDVRVILVALKIFYYYLTKEETKALVITYSSLLTRFLEIENCIPINIAACYCIIAAVPYLEKEAFTNLCDEKLFTFLQSCLLKQSELTEAGLKLFGIMSTRIIGSAFLEQNEIAPLASLFLQSNNKKIKLVAFQAFAAFVTSSPASSTSLSITNVVTKALPDESLSPYPITILSQLMVSPSVTIEIAKNMKLLIPLMDRKSEKDRSICLETLQAVFETLEARDFFDDHEGLMMLFEKAPAFVDTPVWWSMIELIDSASGTSVGLESLSNSSILLLICKELVKKDLTKKQKWHINRILSRLGLSYS